MQVENSSSESGQEGLLLMNIEETDLIGKTVEQYYKTVSQKVDELIIKHEQVTQGLESILSLLNLYGKRLDIIIENVAYDDEDSDYVDDEEEDDRSCKKKKFI